MDIVFEDAWRQGDATRARQAKLFWARLNHGLVEERNRWASELCCMAYDGDQLVGVSTAALRVLPQLPVRLAMYRCAVAPEFRRRELAKRLTARSIEILQRWSANNPAEKVLGLAAIIPAGELGAMPLRPAWPDRGLHLNLAALTPQADQIRIRWFDHARLEG